MIIVKFNKNFETNGIQKIEKEKEMVKTLQ